MAEYNAGSIEATLELNRDPFEAGLAAAKGEGQAFEQEGITVPITTSVDTAQFEQTLQELQTIANATPLTAQITALPNLPSVAAAMAAMDTAAGAVPIQTSVKAVADIPSVLAAQAEMQAEVDHTIYDKLVAIADIQSAEAAQAELQALMVGGFKVETHLGDLKKSDVAGIADALGIEVENKTKEALVNAIMNPTAKQALSSAVAGVVSGVYEPQYGVLGVTQSGSRRRGSAQVMLGDYNEPQYIGGRSYGGFEQAVTLEQWKRQQAQIQALADANPIKDMVEAVPDIPSVLKAQAEMQAEVEHTIYDPLKVIPDLPSLAEAQKVLQATALGELYEIAAVLGINATEAKTKEDLANAIGLSQKWLSDQSMQLNAELHAGIVDWNSIDRSYAVIDAFVASHPIDFVLTSDLNSEDVMRALEEAEHEIDLVGKVPIDWQQVPTAREFLEAIQHQVTAAISIPLDYHLMYDPDADVPGLRSLHGYLEDAIGAIKVQFLSEVDVDSFAKAQYMLDSMEEVITNLETNPDYASFLKAQAELQALADGTIYDPLKAMADVIGFIAEQEKLQAIANMHPVEIPVRFGAAGDPWAGIVMQAAGGGDLGGMSPEARVIFNRIYDELNDMRQSELKQIAAEENLGAVTDYMRRDLINTLARHLTQIELIEKGVEQTATNTAESAAGGGGGGGEVLTGVAAREAAQAAAEADMAVEDAVNAAQDAASTSAKAADAARNAGDTVRTVLLALSNPEIKKLAEQQGITLMGQVATTRAYANALQKLGLPEERLIALAQEVQGTIGSGKTPSAMTAGKGFVTSPEVVSQIIDTLSAQGVTSDIIAKALDAVNRRGNYLGGLSREDLNSLLYTARVNQALPQIMEGKIQISDIEDPAKLLTKPQVAKGIIDIEGLNIAQGVVDKALKEAEGEGGGGGLQLAAGAPAGGFTAGLIGTLGGTTAASAIGLSLAHLVLLAVPVAVSAIGAGLGGGLLALGAAGPAAVGFGTDLAGIGQAAGDIKAVSSNLTALQTAQGTLSQTQTALGPTAAAQQAQLTQATAAVATAQQQVNAANLARANAQFGTPAYTAAIQQQAAAQQNLTNATNAQNTAANNLQQTQSQLQNATQGVTTAQQNLNNTLNGFGAAARGPVLAAANQIQTFKSLFDQYTQYAEATGANIINQATQVGEKYLPTIGKYATENMSIIQQGLQPFFSWLQGPGLAIFTNLENIFQRDLPTGLHAMEQTFELVVKTVNYVATNFGAGGLITKFDDFVTKYNGVDWGKWTGEIDTLIGIFHAWWDLAKQLFDVVRNLLHLEAGTGTGIVEYLTHGLSILNQWLDSSSGQKAVHSLFEAHKGQILDLMQAIGILVSQVAPPLIQLFTDIAQKSGPLLPVFGTVLAGILGPLTQLVNLVLRVPYAGNFIALLLVLEGLKNLPFGFGAGFFTSILNPMERIIALPLDLIATRVVRMGLAFGFLGDALQAYALKKAQAEGTSGGFFTGVLGAKGTPPGEEVTLPGQVPKGFTPVSATGAGIGEMFTEDTAKSGLFSKLATGLSGAFDVAMTGAIGVGIGYLVSSFTEKTAAGLQGAIGKGLTIGGFGLLGAAPETGPAAPFVAAAGLIALAAGEIITHWGKVKGWFEDFWRFMHGGWGTFISGTLAVIVPFIGLPLVIMEHWRGLAAFFTQTVPQAFDASRKALNNWFNVDPSNWSRNLVGAVDRALNAVGLAIVNAGIAIDKALANWFFVNPANWINNIGGAIASVGTTAIGDLAKIGGNIETFLTGLPSEIGHWLEGVAGEFVKIGEDAAAGFFHGLTHRVEQYKNDVKHWILTPVGWAKEFLGIHSPADATVPVGAAMTEGVIKGMNSNASDAITAAKNISQQIADAFKGLGGIQTQWPNIAGMSKFFSELAGAFGNLQKAIQAAGQITPGQIGQITNTLNNTIVPQLPGLIGAMETIDKEWVNLAGITGATGPGETGIKGIQNFNTLFSNITLMFNRLQTAARASGNVTGPGMHQLMATLYSLGGVLPELAGAMQAINKAWLNVAGIVGTTGPGETGIRGIQNFNTLLSNLSLMFNRLQTTIRSSHNISGPGVQDLLLGMYVLAYSTLPALATAMQQINRAWVNIAGVTGTTGHGTSGIRGIQNFDTLLENITLLFNRLQTTINTSGVITPAGLTQLHQQLGRIQGGLQDVLGSMVSLNNVWTARTGLYSPTAGSQGTAGINNFMGILKQLVALYQQANTTAGAAAMVSGGALTQIRNAVLGIGLVIAATLASIAQGPHSVGPIAIRVGGTIATGIAFGIAAGNSQISGAMTAVLNNALNSATTHIQAKSPSALFAARVGQPIAEGIARGIRDGAPQIASALNEVTRVPNVNIPRVTGLGTGITGGMGTVVHYTPTVNTKVINAQGMSNAQLQKAVKQGTTDALNDHTKTLLTLVGANGG